MLLDVAEALRITIDSDFACFLVLVVFIFYSVVDEVENHLVHINTVLLLECEHALVVEEEREATCGTHVTIELIEDRTNVAYSTSGVVGKSVNEDSYSVRTISLVSNLLVFALILTHSVLDSTLDVVLRHVLALSISDDSTKSRIVLWFWTASLYSNGNLLANLCKCTSHVAPSLKLCSFTVFKCSSHSVIVFYFFCFVLGYSRQ